MPFSALKRSPEYWQPHDRRLAPFASNTEITTLGRELQSRSKSEQAGSTYRYRTHATLRSLLNEELMAGSDCSLLLDEQRQYYSDVLDYRTDFNLRKERKEQTTTVRINGMTCGVRTKRESESLNGVASFKISLLVQVPVGVRNDFLFPTEQISKVIEAEAQEQPRASCSVLRKETTSPRAANGSCIVPAEIGTKLGNRFQLISLIDSTTYSNTYRVKRLLDQKQYQAREYATHASLKGRRNYRAKNVNAFVRALGERKLDSIDQGGKTYIVYSDLDHDTETPDLQATIPPHDDATPRETRPSAVGTDDLHPVKQTASYEAKTPIRRAEHPGSGDRKSLSQDLSDAEGTDTSNKVKRRRRKRKAKKNMKAKREQAPSSTAETVLDDGVVSGLHRAGKKARSTGKVERRRLKQWQKRKKKRKTDPFVKCLGEMLLFSCGHRKLELCLSCQKSWDLGITSKCSVLELYKSRGNLSWDEWNRESRLPCSICPLYELVTVPDLDKYDSGGHFLVGYSSDGYFLDRYFLDGLLFDEDFLDEGDEWIPTFARFGDIRRELFDF
jgi:hypothetical protein